MTDEPVAHFQGRAVSYEPVLAPHEYARQGRELRDRAVQALGAGERGEAETLARLAIEQLVDAFLFDRSGHRACFREAHGLGKAVAQIFECPLKTRDHGASWVRDCGISALHQRVGLSRAGTSRGRCSICDAEDFACDHIRGRTYEGHRCYRIIYEMDLLEISLVQFPDDPRCYRLQAVHSRRDVEAAFDGPLPPGATPLCTHCVDCPGAVAGATDDDVDQSRWPAFVP